MDNLTKCPDYKNCDKDAQNYDWSDVIDHTVVAERFGSDEDLTELFAEMEKNGKFNSIFLPI